MRYRIFSMFFAALAFSVSLLSCDGTAEASTYALAGSWYCEAADTGMAANSTLSLSVDGSYTWLWQLGTERGKYAANPETRQLSLQAEFINADTLTTMLQLRFAFQGGDMLILTRDDGQSWVFMRQAD